MLTEGQIKEFQALCERHFGEPISYEEAAECGESLIEMIRRVYKPITQEQYQRHIREPEK